MSGPDYIQRQDVLLWNTIDLMADINFGNPSREEHLLTDYIITIAGRSFTITSHDIIVTGVSLVLGVVFWIALYFSRKRVVVLKRSSGTDQVTLELSRIADALERLANRPADRAIAAAMRRQLQAQSPAPRDSKGSAYSMFGR
ncbi:MAG TPA: hypothetical protein VFB10_05660 [Candidatus Dormibacteraeota bacterium]|nr:hypothetical protein [Candidatus Dormibacteraeota bacterium]